MPGEDSSHMNLRALMHDDNLAVPAARLSLSLQAQLRLAVLSLHAGHVSLAKDQASCEVLASSGGVAVVSPSNLLHDEDARVRTVNYMTSVLAGSASTAPQSWVDAALAVSSLANPQSGSNPTHIDSLTAMRAVLAGQRAVSTEWSYSLLAMSGGKDAVAAAVAVGVCCACEMAAAAAATVAVIVRTRAAGNTALPAADAAAIYQRVFARVLVSSASAVTPSALWQLALHSGWSSRADVGTTPPVSAPVPPEPATPAPTPSSLPDKGGSPWGAPARGSFATDPLQQLHRQPRVHIPSPSTHAPPHDPSGLPRDVWTVAHAEALHAAAIARAVLQQQPALVASPVATAATAVCAVDISESTWAIWRVADDVPPCGPDVGASVSPCDSFVCPEASPDAPTSFAETSCITGTPMAVPPVPEGHEHPHSPQGVPLPVATATAHRDIFAFAAAAAGTAATAVECAARQAAAVLRDVVVAAAVRSMRVPRGNEPSSPLASHADTVEAALCSAEVAAALLAHTAVLAARCALPSVGWFATPEADPFPDSVAAQVAMMAATQVVAATTTTTAERCGGAGVVPYLSPTRLPLVATVPLPLPSFYRPRLDTIGQVAISIHGALSALKARHAAAPPLCAAAAASELAEVAAAAAVAGFTQVEPRPVPPPQGGPSCPPSPATTFPFPLSPTTAAAATPATAAHPTASWELHRAALFAAVEWQSGRIAVAAANAEADDDAERDSVAITATIPRPRSVILGTRALDPHGPKVSLRSACTAGWPSVLRLNPLLLWSVSDVWEVLRVSAVRVCRLYRYGYASLGSRSATRPIPSLLLPYPPWRLPAWLGCDLDERRGRL